MSDSDSEFSDYQFSMSSEDSDLEDLLEERIRQNNENYVEEIVPQYTENEFIEHFRVSREVAHDIAIRFEASNYFKKQSGPYGKISPEKHTYVFLWFAGHQTSSFRDVSDRFNISISCLHKILLKMTYFLSNLSPEIIKWPSNEEQEITQAHFFEKNGFPGIIGVIDGTHIKIDKPEDDPESYFNRKGYYSIQNDIGIVPKGMIKNSRSASNSQNLNLDVINCNISEDTSHYTISDKKSPNLATYYFKHEDIETNMEHTKQVDLEQIQENGRNSCTLDNSFQTNGHVERDVDLEKNNSKEHGNVVLRRHENGKNSRPKSISDDRIRILVQKAEELVSEKRHINKLTKVNNWLKLDKPDDSCDASGEDDEKESQASDDLDASTATLRCTDEHSNSNSSVHDFTCRQWIGSSSRLNDVTPNTGINSFSISESALHQMVLSPRGFSTSFSTVSTNNVNANSNNSTSSTVEEVLPLIAEKSSPIRKKKSKLKKRALFGKSDTHLMYNGNLRNRSHLIKSGSFPGYSTHNINNDTITKHEVFTEKVYATGCSETSTTSGPDSDEDAQKRPVNFKYGGKTRYLHNEPVRSDKSGKSSLTAEEQSSFFSEQAWDNYQENYLSEPYSESRDSDAARRLLNFGEDYRNFIDSQSDWSAFSDISPRMKRKSWPQPNEEDSNSDEESLKQIFSDSREQLNYSKEIYEQIKIGVHSNLVTNEVDDLITTCERHIIILKHMKESPDEFKMSYVDKAITTDLLNQWGSLKNKSLSMDEYQRLRKQIMDLRSFIETFNFSQRRISAVQHSGVEDIYNEMDVCNKLLETLLEQGTNLASLNALIHRFTLDNQDSEEFNETCLKTEISELYELFDNARTCVTDELCQLKSLLPVWRTLESRLEQLQNDLKRDEKTMQALDTSLSNGTFTDKTAASVREVAKFLSETPSSNIQVSEMLTEGSFSDSGISDEGSEQEIGERQRRLAAIRRLVRQLEIGLPEESKARLTMKEKLRVAEEDLKMLQLRCRSLIARTSACSGNFMDRLRLLPGEEESTTSPKTSPGDPDKDPGSNPKAKPWFRRFFKASLAFQLVLLAFVCLSCFFEPSCCDYMNNYSWSFSPKLHYEARPPI